MAGAQGIVSGMAGRYATALFELALDGAAPAHVTAPVPVIPSPSQAEAIAPAGAPEATATAAAVETSEPAPKPARTAPVRTSTKRIQPLADRLDDPFVR